MVQLCLQNGIHLKADQFSIYVSTWKRYSKEIKLKNDSC